MSCQHAFIFNSKVVYLFTDSNTEHRKIIDIWHIMFLILGKVKFNSDTKYIYAVYRESTMNYAMY